MKVKVSCKKYPVIEKCLEILDNRLCRRGCDGIFQCKNSNEQSVELELKVDNLLHPEGFRLAMGADEKMVISGGSPNGVLYGVGKMLRTAFFTKNGFRFGKWRGESTPAKSYRYIYLATHFHNYYHVAPIEEIEEYLEDCALLGYNGVTVCIDKHHFTSPEEPEMIKFVERVKTLFKTAADVGMTTGLSVQANEGYLSTPDHLRATATGRSFYGNEICPSNPEGMQLILKNFTDNFQMLSDVNLKYLCLWPYDQGGCSCSKCAPWGSNGMLRCAREVAALYHSFFPEGKVIYSTWLFNLRGEQEWEGLADALDENDEPWLDMIMADSHREFPEFPLKYGVPGDKPMVNFPEISMWGMYPWGALGATPLIQRFRKIWGKISHICEGGMPYSEGIYEDINKVIYAGFYWTGDNSVSDTLAEYANFEFGCQNTQKLKLALDILEQNHVTKFKPTAILTEKELAAEVAAGKKNLTSRAIFGYKEYQHPPEDASQIMGEINDELPEWGKSSWRWRILYLRALIDDELNRNGLEISDTCEEYLAELAGIFHSAKISEYKVSPLTQESINANRTTKDNV